jgi:hypothetical protein
MSVPAATEQTFQAIGRREDLEDVIYDLFPMDTWAMTNLDRVDATQTFHEWLLDALAGATANRQIEGDDAAALTVNQPSRLGNYTQISRKTFTISGTLEAVKKAGRKSEISRQLMKQMREFKRDVEQALVGNQYSSAGDAASVRSSGGMESWIASTDHGGNAIRATTTNGGSTIGFSAGVVLSPTDGGSTGALTATLLNNALLEAWTDGGNTSIILTGPTQKAVIDGFTSVATRMVDIDRNREKGVPILTSAGVYVSDFGTHTLVLSRYVRSSVILCIDPDYWAQAWLRRPTVETLAKTGDGEKRMIIGEFTLVARNPNASAKVAALT